LSSVVVKSVDAAAVRRAMDEYAGRLLATRPDVETIVVFGSFSTGTYVPGSDLDVFVILTASDKPVRDRIPELLPGAFPVGVDLFPFTRAEMEQLEGSLLVSAVRASTWHYNR
jgi:predicted nucleotidyltransferase